MADTKNVYQRLLEVQRELVAPREIKGRFGNARSAEQILEAAKPVCNKHGLYLHTTDDMTDINGRNYVVATARVVNVDKPEEIVEATAYAWENDVSGGLDTSQVSGKTSSYGKKYALQNLLAIDDTKDADHFDEAPASKPASVRPEIDAEMDAQVVKRVFGLGEKPMSPAQSAKIYSLSTKLGLDREHTEKRVQEMKSDSEAKEAIEKLESMLGAQEQ